MASYQSLLKLFKNSTYQLHLVNLSPSGLSGQPHPVHFIKSNSSSPPYPVLLIQSASSGQLHLSLPRQVNFIQLALSSQFHLVNLNQPTSSFTQSNSIVDFTLVIFFGHLQFILPPNTCANRMEVRKKGRRYRLRAAEERELYMQQFFFSLGFNEAAYKFKERYLKENQGNFCNGQDLRLYQREMRQPQFITKIRGKNNTEYLWLEISLD